VPDGPLRFPFVAAYQGTMQFFADNPTNFAVFGYDWWRELQEAAVNLHEFLADFRTEVTARGCQDPLSKQLSFATVRAAWLLKYTSALKTIWGRR
jgi:hypothetical protein